MMSLVCHREGAHYSTCRPAVFNPNCKTELNQGIKIHQDKHFHLTFAKFAGNLLIE